MMMSLTERESQALGSIAHGLAGSEPRLASMLHIFSRLAAGEEMPAREKIRIRREWPPARPRRARRHPHRGRPPAMLLLWAGISAALLTVALALNACGHTHGQSAGCAIVQLHPQAHMIGNACPRANGGSGPPLGRLSAVSAARSHHP
jgi:hypothetical protein